MESGYKRILAFASVLFVITSSLNSQESLLTVAEKSDFKSTSDYQDVAVFIDRLVKSSPRIRVESIGTSIEGRDIPMLIIGDPLPLSPDELAGDSRIVIYIQANIHAGEVEGKEATLMFARDLLKEKDPELLKHAVVLICPNFNPDGNEQISPLNRTHQNGPVNGVGVRHNGQFLDLNRDAMKAETPEVRGVISRVFNRWDPAVFMDCHTTNGSFHVEPVTFTWMVNPNGDNTLIQYMRDRMMPAMSSMLLDKYNVENCFYGEFIDMLKPESGWIYDASDPRYMSNYYGLRNRLGILNENYVYADYRSRVMGCYYLIRSLGDYVASHREEIRKIVRDADQRTVRRGNLPSVKDSFAIKYKVRPLAEKVTIKTFEAEPDGEEDGWKKYRKTDKQKTVAVPYYIDFYPSESVRYPYAYLLTVRDPEITGLLKIQGIRLEELIEASDIEVERFEISELKAAPRLNQGHYTNSVKGKTIRETAEFPAGTIVVRTAQPLAGLAAYLLEPQSNDGLLTWNYFDRYLVPQWGRGYYPVPVFKVMEKTDLRTRELKNI